MAANAKKTTKSKMAAKSKMATNENDAVHTIKVFTIAPKDYKCYQIRICELFKF